MGSVLFLASWAVLMGPLTYGTSLHPRLRSELVRRARVGLVRSQPRAPAPPSIGAPCLAPCWPR